MHNVCGLRQSYAEIVAFYQKSEASLKLINRKYLIKGCDISQIKSFQVLEF